jgi:hypothetical protein
LKGEPNGIAPGTVQMEKAEVGKTLLAQDPSLLEDEQKLHSAINEAIRERIQADSDVPF